MPRCFVFPTNLVSVLSSFWCQFPSVDWPCSALIQGEPLSVVDLLVFEDPGCPRSPCELHSDGQAVSWFWASSTGTEAFPEPSLVIAPPHSCQLLAVPGSSCWSFCVDLHITATCLMQRSTAASEMLLHGSAPPLGLQPLRISLTQI